MPTTTNYGWTYPSEGGSSGTWDTILNALFVEADADLKAVENKADIGNAAGLGNFLLAGAAGQEAHESAVTIEVQWSSVGAGQRNWSRSAGTNAHRLYFRLPNLPVGKVLSAIRSYGSQTSQTTTIALVSISQDGNETVVSAGHTLPSSAAVTETTGIAHTIAAGTDYYIRVLLTEPTTGLVSLRSVGYTVAAS